MSAYVNRITDLAGKLKGIGIELTDQEITDVLIFNLDNEYSIIAASLMAAKEELKVTEVTSTLLYYFDHMFTSRVTPEKKLFFFIRLKSKQDLSAISGEFFPKS